MTLNIVYVHVQLIYGHVETVDDTVDEIGKILSSISTTSVLLHPMSYRDGMR